MDEFSKLKTPATRTVRGNAGELSVFYRATAEERDHPLIEIVQQSALDAPLPALATEAGLCVNSSNTNVPPKRQRLLIPMQS